MEPNWCWHFSSFWHLTMRVVRSVLRLAQVILVLLQPGVSAPNGFPASGNGLWYTQPGNVWSREWLPIGNGYLAGNFSCIEMMCNGFSDSA